jgi:hypothetical protein
MAGLVALGARIVRAATAWASNSGVLTSPPAPASALAWRQSQ